LVSSTCFRGNRCPLLERTLMPFSMLTRLPGKAARFELIVRAQDGILLEDTDSPPRSMGSNFNQAEGTMSLFAVGENLGTKEREEAG
jgi:hypothetical protein